MSRSGCSWALAFIILAAAAPAWADVYVNRDLIGPPPACPYVLVIRDVPGTLTLDSAYQNAYGDCKGLDSGPPFFVERGIDVDSTGTLDVELDGGTMLLDYLAGEPILVAAGGHLDLHGPVDTAGAPLGTVLMESGTSWILVEGGTFDASGVTFVGLPGSGVVSVQQSPSASLDHCSFSFDSPYGFLPMLDIFGNEDPATTASVTHCTFAYPSGTPVPGAVVIAGVTGPTLVADNAFLGGDGHQLFLANLGDLTLTDNLYTHTTCSSGGHADCGAGVILSAVNTIATLAGNTGLANQVVGIACASLFSAPIASWTTSPGFPLAFTNNTFGVQIPGGSTLTLSGAVLKFLNGVAGLDVYGTLLADHVTVTSLDDDTVGGHTLLLAPAAAPHAGDWQGISLESSGALSLTDSTLRYATYGVRSSQNGTGAFNPLLFTVTDSTIAHSQIHGIQLEPLGGIHADVEHNVVEDSGAVGIYVNTADAASSLLVAHNQVLGSGGDGIQLFYSIGAPASAVLDGNLVAASGGHGIYEVYSFGAILANNIVTTSALAGVAVCSAQVVNNDIFGNCGDGIDVAAATPTLTVANNLVTANSGYGLNIVAGGPGSPGGVVQATVVHDDLFGNGAGPFHSLYGGDLADLPNASGNLFLTDPALPAEAGTCGGSYDVSAVLPEGAALLGAGDASVLPPVIATDYAGNPRVVAGSIDIGAYQAAPPPMVSGPLVPGSGPSAGGTVVLVNGSGFGAGVTVSFDGSAASLIAVTPGQISLTTPPHAAGAVDVVVAVPGQPPVTLPGAYTYVDPAPALISIFPTHGAGGTVVSLSGAHFASGVTVDFGGVAAVPLVRLDADTLEATAPPGAAATIVDVRVTNPDGQSATLAAAFTYDLDLPVITSPISGTVTPDTVIALAGTGLPGAMLLIADQGTAIAPGASVAADGSIAVALTLGYGVHSLTVAQATGTLVSAPAGPIAVTVTPPAPVVTEAPTGLTETLHFAGTGIPGATVTASDGTGPLGSASVFFSGTWSLDLVLADGSYTIQFTQTVDGVTSAPTPGQTVTLYTQPPLVTIVAPVGGSSVAAAVVPLDVRYGVTPAGDAVVATTYFLDGRVLYSGAVAGAPTTLDLTSVHPGRHVLGVSARDSLGNSDAQPTTVAFNYAPSLATLVAVNATLLDPLVRRHGFTAQDDQLLDTDLTHAEQFLARGHVSQAKRDLASYVRTLQRLTGVLPTSVINLLVADAEAVLREI